jgi:spermidine synthase
MDPRSSTESGQAARLPPLMLFLTAGITGAMVMVVEILGARIIGPFFGVSLFVWTALISVTLLALAFGYAFGGALADRHPTPDRLYLLIAAAGLWLVLLPYFKAAVLEAMVPAGLRLGTFLAATLLFGLPLFLLGCVSPFILRLAALDLARLGRTAGLLYAVSTAGSFLGSAGTGFYLLGSLGVIATLRLAGAVLILLAVAYFAGARRWRGLALLAGLLPLAWPPAHTGEARLADGTHASIVWARDSFYGAVKVVEYRGTAMRTREMTIDGLIQGGIDAANGQSIYEYSYLLERLPLAIHPTGQSALMVGLGAGVVPRRLAARGIATEVVELDPQVLAAARRHFGFPATIPVAIEDARTFLARPGKAYDYLLIDVFNGDTTPGYLLSREALQSAKARLAPDGILAFNLIGSVDPVEGMLPSVLATLRESFRETRIQDAGAKAGSGNFVILAADRSLNFAVAPDMASIHPLAASAAMLLHRPALPVASAGVRPLSDDFNPLDLRDTHLKEQVRRDLLNSTPPAILHALPGKIG